MIRLYILTRRYDELINIWLVFWIEFIKSIYKFIFTKFIFTNLFSRKHYADLIK